MKQFVAVVVLQLPECSRLSVEARLPECCRPNVVGRFAAAADITVRMLLGHRNSNTDYNLLGLIIDRITGRF